MSEDEARGQWVAYVAFVTLIGIAFIAGAVMGGWLW